MRISIALILAVIGLGLAAFFYREGDRLSSEADMVFQDRLRLSAMEAARARGEQNSIELEEYRRTLIERYRSSKISRIYTDNPSNRLSDIETDFRDTARSRMYLSAAAAALGLLTAVVVVFRRRKPTRSQQTQPTEN